MHSSDMMYHYRFLISEQARYPLINVHTGEPLKVVEHIGCHYSKIFPSKSVGGAEYPRVLAGLVEALGGSVVDYPERRRAETLLRLRFPAVPGQGQQRLFADQHL